MKSITNILNKFKEIEGIISQYHTCDIVIKERKQSYNLDTNTNLYIIPPSSSFTSVVLEKTTITIKQLFSQEFIQYIVDCSNKYSTFSSIELIIYDKNKNIILETEQPLIVITDNYLIESFFLYWYNNKQKAWSYFIDEDMSLGSYIRYGYEDVCKWKLSQTLEYIINKYPSTIEDHYYYYITCLPYYTKSLISNLLYLVTFIEIFKNWDSYSLEQLHTNHLNNLDLSFLDQYKNIDLFTFLFDDSNRCLILNNDIEQLKIHLQKNNIQRLQYKNYLYLSKLNQNIIYSFDKFCELTSTNQDLEKFAKTDLWLKKSQVKFLSSELLYSCNSITKSEYNFLCNNNLLELLYLSCNLSFIIDLSIYWLKILNKVKQCIKQYWVHDTNLSLDKFKDTLQLLSLSEFDYIIEKFDLLNQDFFSIKRFILWITSENKNTILTWKKSIPELYKYLFDLNLSKLKLSKSELHYLYKYQDWLSKLNISYSEIINKTFNRDLNSFKHVVNGHIKKQLVPINSKTYKSICLVNKKSVDVRQYILTLLWSKNKKWTSTNPGLLYHTLKNNNLLDFNISKHYNTYLSLIQQFSNDSIIHGEFTIKVEPVSSPYYWCAWDFSNCCMWYSSWKIQSYIFEPGFSIINFYNNNSIIWNCVVWMFKYNNTKYLVIDNIECLPRFSSLLDFYKQDIINFFKELWQTNHCQVIIQWSQYNDFLLGTKKIHLDYDQISPLYFDLSKSNLYKQKDTITKREYTELEQFFSLFYSDLWHSPIFVCNIDNK